MDLAAEYYLQTIETVFLEHKLAKGEMLHRNRLVDPSKIKLDWDKLREARKEAATRDVRASLLLERIADAESIYATNEEVDRELNALAKREREPVAALRMKLEKDGTLGRIAARIRTEKVLNFLFENARKVAPPVAEEQPAPAETES